VMWRKTFETMKDYFPKAKKKWYPYAKRTIVLSSSMEEEPWVEIIHKVSELVEKYRNETIVVLWWANVFESVAWYLDKILITTFPEECEWDTYTPHLPAWYVWVDWEYLENRPEKYKDSKLKHEVWTPIRDSTSLAIVEICKYEQSIQK
jgi:dihydrofolate reductase